MYQRNKLLVLSFVFIGATGFFLWLFNKTLYNTRASGETVTLAFDKVSHTASPGETIPLNIMFTMPGSTQKVSAGKVSLRYTTRTLEFAADNQSKVDVVCTDNDFSLTMLMGVEHDATNGTVAISRAFPDPDNTKLPPHRPNNMSCFTTVYFTAKASVGGVFNPIGRVSMIRETDACEFVGPVDKTYGCSFTDRASVAGVRINQNALTPQPTRPQTPPGKECGRCGTIAGIECESGLVCLQPNHPDFQGYCVKPDNSSKCVATDSASLSFRPLSAKEKTGETFSVDVIINAGKHQILSTDARLRFDSQKLEVVEIKDGSYFQIARKWYQNAITPQPRCQPGALEESTSLTSSDEIYDLNDDGFITGADYGLAIQKPETARADFVSALIGRIDTLCVPDNARPGNMYIAGIVQDPTSYKTGSGVLATLVFRAKNPGTSHLAVVCRPGQTANDSNIANNDYNVADIIDCQANGSSEITVTGGSNSCPRLKEGDCDCDGVVDIGDFEPWRGEFVGESATKKCDFNGNGSVRLDDFNIWRGGFFTDRRAKPTIVVDPPTAFTPAPTKPAVPTVSPTGAAANLTPAPTIIVIIATPTSVPLPTVSSGSIVTPTP